MLDFEFHVPYFELKLGVVSSLTYSGAVCREKGEK